MLSVEFVPLKNNFRMYLKKYPFDIRGKIFNIEIGLYICIDMFAKSEKSWRVVNRVNYPQVALYKIGSTHLYTFLPQNCVDCHAKYYRLMIEKEIISLRKFHFLYQRLFESNICH